MVTTYASLYGPGLVASPISCTITSPAPSASLTVGTPVLITGTISQPGQVTVTVNSVVIGLVLGAFSWSCAYTPANGDVGAPVIGASATATAPGVPSGNAPTVTVNVAGNTPLTMAGNANISFALRADQGVTLGSNMLATAGNGGSGAITLGGTLAQARAVHVMVGTAGTEVTCRVSISADGGATYLINPADSTQFWSPAQAATALAAFSLTLSFGAGSYNLADTHSSCIAQWVDQKNGFVFAQSTPSARPALNYSRAGGQLSVNLNGASWLSCATAGVAAAFAAANPAFSLYVGMRSGGAVAGVAGIIGVGSTSSAGAFWHMYNSTTAWETFSGSGAAAGTITADSRYIVEYFHTGTAESLIVNGTTVKNATAQSLTLSSAVDTVVIGGTAIHGVPANFGDQYIDEIVVYSANNHATTSPTVPAYFNARYVDLVSSAIPNASFNDTLPRTSALGGIPIPSADVPNDSKQAIGLYGRLKYTVPLGCTGVDVTAVTHILFNDAHPILSNVLVWLDGVAQSPLSFTGPMSLRQTQRLALDGAAHTLELDERAAIVGVAGVGAAVTLVAPTPPNTRVFAIGDSITDGYSVDFTDRTLCWAEKLRHSLSATYGTTIWGIIGITLFQYAQTSGVANTWATTQVAPQADGTAKNIVVLSLGTNDWGNGVTAANYLAYLQNAVAAIHTALPSAKIVIGSPIQRTGEGTPNAGGATLPNFRTQCSTVVTANSAFCTLFDGSVYAPGSDGLHPNAATYATMAADMKTLILTL